LLFDLRIDRSLPASITLQVYAALRGQILAGDLPEGRRLPSSRTLARDLDVAKLDAITREIGLGEAIATAGDLLDGKVRGRVVVDVNR